MIYAPNVDAGVAGAMLRALVSQPWARRSMTRPTCSRFRTRSERPDEASIAAAVDAVLALPTALGRVQHVLRGLTPAHSMSCNGGPASEPRQRINTELWEAANVHSTSI